MGRRSFPPAYLFRHPLSFFFLVSCSSYVLPPLQTAISLQTWADMCPCVVVRRKVTAMKVWSGSFARRQCVHSIFLSRPNVDRRAPPTPLPPPSLSSSSSSCSSLIEPDTGGREHPVRLLTRKSSMGQPSRGCDRPERVRDLARSAPPTKPSVDSNRLDAYRALAWTLRRSTDVLGNDPSTFSTLLRLA